MLNQGNNMSYYGRSEYFRHLRIERLDGDVTPVFSDYLRTVRTLPFTVVTCQERLEGFPYHGSSCIFEDEGEIHAEGASCWVIPAGVRHRFLALDEGHLSIWGHFNFFLEPNWNILRFYRVPRAAGGGDSGADLWAGPDPGREPTRDAVGGLPVETGGIRTAGTHSRTERTASRAAGFPDGLSGLSPASGVYPGASGGIPRSGSAGP